MSNKFFTLFIYQLEQFFLPFVLSPFNEYIKDRVDLTTIKSDYHLLCLYEITPF